MSRRIVIIAGSTGELARAVAAAGIRATDKPVLLDQDRVGVQVDIRDNPMMHELRKEEFRPQIFASKKKSKREWWSKGDYSRYTREF